MGVNTYVKNAIFAPLEERVKYIISTEECPARFVYSS
jgi:hypothetical protein